ncbi:MAG TPA: hypothetical protein VMW93_01660 [bacterium]|nr:hypothetical protein [bacterium]
MKTSSFFVAGRLPGAVSIARSAPAWFGGPKYEALAPPWHLIEGFKAGRITWEKYVEFYRDAVLADLDAALVWDELHYLVAEEPVLCCWCRVVIPNAVECHRHVVAAWLEDRLPGVVVPELEAVP